MGKGAEKATTDLKTVDEALAAEAEAKNKAHAAQHGSNEPTSPYASDASARAQAYQDLVMAERTAPVEPVNPAALEAEAKAATKAVDVALKVA